LALLGDDPSGHLLGLRIAGSGGDPPRKRMRNLGITCELWRYLQLRKCLLNRMRVDPGFSQPILKVVGRQVGSFHTAQLITPIGPA
jgi:hypothetical protein